MRRPYPFHSNLTGRSATAQVSRTIVRHGCYNSRATAKLVESRGEVNSALKTVANSFELIKGPRRESNNRLS